MGYMEIALLSSDSIRIKGKHSSIVINPQNKSIPLQVAILIGTQQGKNFISSEGVTIDGPGEYEVGGIKISGVQGKDTRSETGQARHEVVYSMTVDGVAIAVGTLSGLHSSQQKMKEHNIAVVLALDEIEASFVTSMAVNAVLFYGSCAAKALSGFAKENVKEVNKYQVTLEKLPQEIETVLLV